MKKVIITFVVTLTSILSISSMQAGQVVSEISQLLFYEGGDLLYIYPVGGTGAKNRVGCHGSNGDYIAYKLDRPRAKEYVASLMMAFAANKKVRLVYADSCTDQSVAVTLRYFAVIQ